MVIPFNQMLFDGELSSGLARVVIQRWEACGSEGEMSQVPVIMWLDHDMRNNTGFYKRKFLNHRLL